MLVSLSNVCPKQIQSGVKVPKLAEICYKITQSWKIAQSWSSAIAKSLQELVLVKLCEGLKWHPSAEAL